MIEPPIHYGNNSPAGLPHATPPALPESPNHSARDKAHEDILMHSFWQCARGTVFDIRICDTDARSYANTSSDKVLEHDSKEKIRKYKPACLAHLDGLASKGSRKAKQRLACVLVKKWDRAYSDVANFIRVRMSLAITLSNTLLLRGDRNHILCHRAPTKGIDVASTASLHNH
ncbi:hypothetical protein ACHAW6_004343 [Cyclotella cf. meneghiniana]